MLIAFRKLTTLDPDIMLDAIETFTSYIAIDCG